MTQAEIVKKIRNAAANLDDVAEWLKDKSQEFKTKFETNMGAEQICVRMGVYDKVEADNIETFVFDYNNSGLGHIPPKKQKKEMKQQPQPPAQPQQLPKELQRPEITKVIADLVEADYIITNGGRYTWNKSAKLFGYLCAMVTSHFCLADRIPWKLFREAFNVSDKNLLTARTFITHFKTKKYNEPQGYEVINKALGGVSSSIIYDLCR